MVERIELVDNNENLQSVVFQDVEDYDENNDFKGINELDKFLNYFSNSKLTRNYINKYFRLTLSDNSLIHDSGFYFFKRNYESEKQCKRRIAEDSIYSVKKLVNLIKESAKYNEDLFQYFTYMKIKSVKDDKIKTFKTAHRNEFPFNYYKINIISKWLRIYAVSTNKKDIIITEGYLKPTKKIEDLKVGQNELNKIKFTYDFITKKEVKNDNS